MIANKTQLLALFLLPLLGCEAEDALVRGGGAVVTEATRDCTPDDKVAIVTDIDETLTFSDEEFIIQFGNADYDPIERADACTMIATYHARGYFVFYVTARPSDMNMGGTGTTSEQATNDWLDRKGCPRDDRTRVTFAPELVFGETAHAYKAATLAGFQAEGFSFSYAYGNATSDIDAYEDGGIPKRVTFIIGTEAGGKGTVAVAGEAWTEHLAEQLPTVAGICNP